MRPWRERFYEKGGYIADLSDSFIDAVITAAEKSPEPSLGMQGIPVTMLMRMGGAIDDVDNDAMAFSRKNGAFFWDASAAWQSPRDDEVFIGWCRELNAMLEPLSSLRDTSTSPLTRSQTGLRRSTAREICAFGGAEAKMGSRQCARPQPEHCSERYRCEREPRIREVL